MEKKMYESGVVAIPLKNKVDSLLQPCPNFFVIDAQSGKSISPTINLQTGLTENNSCVNIIYKIVYREILEANNIHQQEFVERVIQPYENLAVSVDLLPIIFTLQRVKDNLAIVNSALSHFSFRGILKNFKLEIDEDVLDEILAETEFVPEPDDVQPNGVISEE